MILGLQIITLLFALTMVYFAVLNFKRREIDRSEMVVWVGVWTFAIIAIIFPDSLQLFARNFKFARLFDMMVVGGLILVIMMVSKAYISTRRTEKKLEKFVRKDALKNVKKGK
ncbi:MAG: hypothetical protein UU12_C0001G0015 [Candidatus Woesebacteria bacterium GW2011_GWA2_40_7b]|uniref:DUF2304 domain-containing protein n=1 Tax=Candidatus Woesebacteria bacterium GW2011_GWA2_40_7b TaxID=1618563 RepID=A0A0G0W881_9BACT|nr:MAG: hypothetical protein UU12_C0001G0015 [Candidatus Woesebacteria bacterium GW2011_GWA2_40_7b]